MSVQAPARDDVDFATGPSGTATTSEPGPLVILALLAGFVTIWTVYLALTEAPFGIKHDMAEAYAWGREFQLGYNQHPPFWAWVCGLWFAVLPHTTWAFALLSSLNAGIGLWGAWMLIGNFASGSKRRAAWLLLMLTPLYTFYAYRYDANTIFLSIWPWTLHCFLRSIRSRGIGDAVGFGICVGLALMSKYYAVILLATCALAVLQHPARRAYLTSAAPYVAACVTALICAPHVVWLLTHRAPPLRYLASVSDRQWGAVFTGVKNTLAGTLGMNLAVILVVALVAWRARRDDVPTPVRGRQDPILRILATLALAPLVLTVISAIALRTTTTAEMPIGTFALVPLLAIELAGISDIDRLYRLTARLACVVTFGALALSPAIAAMRVYLSPAGMKAAPYQEAADAVTRLWHARTARPLAYVAGSPWYDNEIAFYSADRPHAFVDFDYARNLWVTPEALARHGLLSICVSDDRTCLAETARFVTPETTRSELSLARVLWGHSARPVWFVVTIIPPHA